MNEKNLIHPTAIIHPGAELAEDVSIGPYSLIGENVKIGSGTVIASHVSIEGHTSIGKNNQFFHFCSIGAPPQDLSYKGEDTEVVIGDNNVFREYNSVHRGTLKENRITKIGSSNLFMAYVHIGHDVVVGDKCIVANSCNFAGHVKVDSGVIMGGACNVSQFVSLGRNCYIGGASAVDKDIPDFCTAYGNRIRLKGINIIGLRRSGVSKQDVTEVVDFYRVMEASALSPRAFVGHEEMIKEYADNTIIQGMIKFIKRSEVGLPPFMS